jgi:hypothetical protein
VDINNRRLEQSHLEHLQPFGHPAKGFVRLRRRFFWPREDQVSSRTSGFGPQTHKNAKFSFPPSKNNTSSAIIMPQVGDRT